MASSAIPAEPATHAQNKTQSVTTVLIQIESSQIINWLALVTYPTLTTSPGWTPSPAPQPLEETLCVFGSVLLRARGSRSLCLRPE